MGSIGFPCGVMIANTYNEDIARSFGQSIGEMADEMNVSGWYAPAMNIHRSAFAGRNFEYYSEDGLLSGKIASQAVQGAAEHGVYAYIVIVVLIVLYEALRVRKVYGKRKAAGKGTAQE